MTKRRFAACAATLAAAVAATPGLAAAADQPLDRVLVRTEGKNATLAEGPLLTRGRTIQATSDATPRTCDATNNGGTVARPTPTASTVDAMNLAGRAFDGDWYAGFDDYFVTQFGPDRQQPGANEYYGILVNGIYTSVGGCQYGMARGDVALWIYDAFNSRLALRLDGPEGIGEPTSTSEHTPSIAPTKNTFTVALDEPFTVHVKGLFNTSDPGNYTAAAGVDVSPVTTDAVTGDQTVRHDDPATVVSDANGNAKLTWSTPGWKRIKAEKLATASGRASIRSNRLDVCVRNARGEDCGPPPADARLRGLDAPRFSGDEQFGTLARGTSSATRTIGFGNPDSLPVTVSSLGPSGDMAADFTVESETCTKAPLGPGASCEAQVRFAPRAGGARAAALDAKLGSGETITARLAGTGTGAEPGTTPGTGTPAPSPTAAPVGPPTLARTPPRAQLEAGGLTLRLGGTRRVDRRGRFAVKVRCLKRATCRGTVTLRTTKGRYLGRAAYRVRAGRLALVRVKLTPSARRLLRRRRTLRAVARSGRVTTRVTIRR